MQYKNSKKIIIDRRKLETLFRLGCPDNQILQLLRTGEFTPTGDSLIDETLECLVDFKEFENWGGKREGSGRPKNNQLENQLENQDTIQDVDKDKDKDRDKDKDKEYAFEGEVIKLNQKDYDSWKERFNLLDFDYELEKRDIWLKEQQNTKNWFISTAQYFLKLQNEKEKAREKEIQATSNWWRE